MSRSSGTPVRNDDGRLAGDAFTRTDGSFTSEAEHGSPSDQAPGVPGHPRRRARHSDCSSPAARPPPGALAPARDVIQELGVRSFINAAGTFTALTGSLMRPEVMEAMQVASRKYVVLDELHDAVGKRIAELLGCPAALVTSGCASALSLATAACVAGSDRGSDPPPAGHRRHEERSPRPEDAPRRLRPRHPQRGREDDRGPRPGRSWRRRSTSGPR